VPAIKQLIERFTCENAVYATAILSVRLSVRRCPSASMSVCHTRVLRRNG